MAGVGAFALAALALVAAPLPGVPSASAATLPQAVVTLTSSLNPATVRQMVTLTATVRAPAGGGQAPTGTVSFVDSRASFICRSVAISLGRATCIGRRPHDLGQVRGRRNVWPDLQR